MSEILIDNIRNLAIHSGVLRVECIAISPDGQLQPSGTLIIPVAVATTVIESLTRGLKDLERKLSTQELPPAGTA